jgi:hypothetical protein
MPIRKQEIFQVMQWVIAQKNKQKSQHRTSSILIKPDAPMLHSFVGLKKKCK